MESGERERDKRGGIFYYVTSEMDYSRWLAQERLLTDEAGSVRDLVIIFLWWPSHCVIRSHGEITLGVLRGKRCAGNYFGKFWDEVWSNFFSSVPHINNFSLFVCNLNIHLWSGWCLSPVTTDPVSPHRLCHLPPGVHIHILLGKPAPVSPVMGTILRQERLYKYCVSPLSVANDTPPV